MADLNLLPAGVRHEQVVAESERKRAKAEGKREEEGVVKALARRHLPLRGEDQRPNEAVPMIGRVMQKH